MIGLWHLHDQDEAAGNKVTCTHQAVVQQHELKLSY
jgi:hypothetical protein